ncbi:16 kDa calcium-binding protein-like [Tubulanus polymorphus]|uniref:16 kDa calcium-binding protein-like n=1 Tax=Tubulanus polymorphus TaxID=672921 RepID=UPI003DA241C2
MAHSAEEYLSKLEIPVDEATLLECKNALEVFAKYDEDLSDTLNKEEMEKMLRDHGRADPKLVKKYFEYCDLDEDGNVSREEFLKATVGITMSDCWRRVFNEFDKDKNGFIDEVELCEVFKSIGISDASQTNIRSFIEKHDLDNDGRIDYEEFLEIITKAAK